MASAAGARRSTASPSIGTPSSSCSAFSLPPAAPATPSSAPQASGLRRRARPAKGSGDERIQALLRLPGFSWEPEAYWIIPWQKLTKLLGTEVPDDHGHFRPADTQKTVAHRVADCIEACCDTWLDSWQDGPLLASFWDQAAARLTQSHVRYRKDGGITAIELFKIVMTYIPRWDPNGRGASEEEMLWGFERGGLTWGNRRAELNKTVLAMPWLAARDFFEYLNDTENDFGPIQMVHRLGATLEGDYAFNVQMPSLNAGRYAAFTVRATATGAQQRGDVQDVVMWDFGLPGKNPSFPPSQALRPVTVQGPCGFDSASIDEAGEQVEQMDIDGIKQPQIKRIKLNLTPPVKPMDKKEQVNDIQAEPSSSKTTPTAVHKTQNTPTKAKSSKRKSSTPKSITPKSKGSSKTKNKDNASYRPSGDDDDHDSDEGFAPSSSSKKRKKNAGAAVKKGKDKK